MVEYDYEFEALLNEKKNKALLRAINRLVIAADSMQSAMASVKPNEQVSSSLSTIFAQIKDMQNMVATLAPVDHSQKIIMEIQQMSDRIAAAVSNLADRKPPEYEFIIHRNKISGFIESVEAKIKNQ